jgi:hypothetical protein
MYASWERLISRADSRLIPSQVCKQMLGLKEKCMHPTKNTEYIKTSIGGRDNSPENLQVHGFIFFSGTIRSLGTSAESTGHSTELLMPL